MSETGFLAIIALIIGLGIGAKVLGDRLGVPEVLFFVLMGLLIGPPGLGLLHHALFGEGLAPIVGVSVAIIVFHDATAITVEELRRAPRMAYSLATVGSLITFLGTAAMTYVAMNVSPGIALFIGALLVATGPTVVEPILSIVPARDHLASTLEIEGLINEVTAAILAFAVFDAVTLQQTNLDAFLLTLTWHLVAGILVGVVGAGVVWFLFRIPEHASEHAPQHARLLWLAAAIVTYATAETIAAESGIAAVATMGILLGNADLPYQDHISEFESDVSTFILAFVFVALASMVDTEWLAVVGINGLLVAVGLMVVVRPLAVFLSTINSTFTRREKLFLSTVAPRGIVPAGIVILFALTIQESNPEAAANITGTVLLVILATVVVEGGLAPSVAKWLDVTDDPTIVVGGGPFGMALAAQYAEQGGRVRIVEYNRETIEAAQNDGYAVYHGDGADPDVLQDAGGGQAKRLVAATDDDETNLAVVRLARTRFDIPTVLVRLNEDDNRELFEEFDVKVISGSQLDLWALDHFAQGSAPDWLVALERTGGVKTVSVTADRAVGRTVASLDAALPDRSIIVALTRDGETMVPDGSVTIEPGDRVTVLGRSAAVDEAATYLDHTVSDTG